MNFILALFGAILVIACYNWLMFIKYNSVEDHDNLIGLLSPIIEEATKTTMAVVFNTAIIPVHLGFGLVEGFKDYVAAKQFRGLIVSGMLHMMFGIITVYVTNLTGFLILGILISVVAHISWNKYIVNITI